MKKIFVSGLVLLFGLAPASMSAQKVKDLMSPLPQGCIHFTNYLEDAIQNSMAHWNKGNLPYTKLVDVYRGDKRPNFAVGEMWAKAVRSGSLLYRYTHDAELKRIMQETMKDALTAVRSNGTLAVVPPNKQPDSKGGDLWERKYVILGLYQYYKDIEADPKVFKLMIDETNSLLDQIGEAPKIDITRQGWTRTGIESSSILEPVMLVYEMTKEKKYLDFAKYIIDKGGCYGANIFEEAINNVRPRKMANRYPKAYEMLSVFEGVAEYYRATGEDKYKTSFMNLFNNLKEYEITIIGNGGGDQPYFPQYRGEAWNDTRWEQANPKIERMMETCAGVTWMKLCMQILRLTGEPSAVDYIEKYVYNGLLGAMKPGGNGFSYVNLLNGRKQTDTGWGYNFGDFRVTCCNLSGPIGLSHLPLLAIMQASNGPVVNLYNAATATVKTAKGQNLNLNLDTKFPLNNKVVITLSGIKAENFNIKLHMPQWSYKTVVTVNGAKVNNIVPGKYLDLTRTWKSGDRVEITFDMRCIVMDAPAGSNKEALDYQAVQYGPIVLARDENIDANYNQPVRIKANSYGEVNITPVKPTLSTTRMEFIVPTTTGNIHMVDYSSVNGWEGKKVCTWMPMKK